MSPGLWIGGVGVEVPKNDHDSQLRGELIEMLLATIGSKVRQVLSIAMLWQVELS